MDFDATASKPFLVPDNVVLRGRILKLARPRQLTPEIAAQTYWRAAMRAERAPLVAQLSAEVIGKATKLGAIKDADLPVPSSAAMTASHTSQMSKIRRAINDAGRQLEAAALLWRLTGDQRFFDEALTRGNQLAGLSPTGPTSFANQDQAARQIALSLMKAIDLLAADLPAAPRASISIRSIRTAPPTSGC